MYYVWNNYIHLNSENTCFEESELYQILVVKYGENISYWNQRGIMLANVS